MLIRVQLGRVLKYSSTNKELCLSTRVLEYLSAGFLSERYELAKIIDEIVGV